MPKGQRTPLHIQHKIAEEYRATGNAAAIAKKYNVAANTVYRIGKLKPNGKHVRKKVARKVDPVEKMADALLAGFRTMLVTGLRDLVQLGVQERIEALLATMKAPVAEIS